MGRAAVPAGERQPELEPIERASADELRALQLERLRWTLAHAYANVACYRAKCELACVHPQDLRALDDLRHFPFTVKDDLRENYPFGMFAVPREQLVRLHASSGTTGRPTVVGYTRADNPNFQNSVTGLSEKLAHSGLGAHEAHAQAYARIYQNVQAQAASLAYVDTFMVLAVVAGIMFFLAFLLKKNDPGGGGMIIAE